MNKLVLHVVDENGRSFIGSWNHASDLDVVIDRHQSVLITIIIIIIIKIIIIIIIILIITYFMKSLSNPMMANMNDPLLKSMVRCLDLKLDEVQQHIAQNQWYASLFLLSKHFIFAFICV